MSISGFFITLEGPEGSGKSTQALRLVDSLRDGGREVVHVREPGGTRTGELIRRVLQHDECGEPLVPEAELFLFEASRAQLVRSVIAPALEKGACVVCDRFADSTTAYQGYGRGFDIEGILAVNQIAIHGASPNLTLLLDADVAEGLKRLDARAGVDARDRFEREALDFHERVRQGYLELAKANPGRFEIIDAGRDEETVASDVWRVVSARLGLGDA